ncbi:hypothetical protein Tco_1183073 [Tanacetum coccineum]
MLLAILLDRFRQEVNYKNMSFGATLTQMAIRFHSMGNSLVEIYYLKGRIMVNYADNMANKNVPSPATTRSDDQILLFNAWVPIGKALTASADVPSSFTATTETTLTLPPPPPLLQQLIVHQDIWYSFPQSRQSQRDLPRDNSLVSVEVLRCSGLRTASAAAKPCQGDSSEFYLITGNKFENASNSLNKLIEYQIVDNYKKGLGYEKYNAVPRPYTGNFMPLIPDLSFTGLDEFVNKPVVENRKSDEEVSKVVRKSDDSLIIEDWVSDSEGEKVS